MKKQFMKRISLSSADAPLQGKFAIIILMGNLTAFARPIIVVRETISLIFLWELSDKIYKGKVIVVDQSMMLKKRGLFLVVLVLILAVYSSNFVLADTSGCYVYPKASEDLYCVPGILGW